MEDCSVGQSAVVWAQTLEAFVVTSRLYAKFGCPVVWQNVPLHFCASLLHNISVVTKMLIVICSSGRLTKTRYLAE